MTEVCDAERREVKARQWAGEASLRERETYWTGRELDRQGALFCRILRHREKER
jgi:hypothetical protein